MATDAQWQLVEWDQGAKSACIVELRDRVEKLEAAQNLRQQDEDVEGVAAPRPMDADLLRHFQGAPGYSLDRLRAVYQLGRKHGATQATCPHIRKSDDGTGYCSLAEQTADSQPTPNDGQIRSSAPAGGLVERLANLLGHHGDGTARAAIREVASWLRSKSGGHLGSGQYWSQRMEEEAGQ